VIKKLKNIYKKNTR